MGKTVAKVLAVVAGVAAFIVNPALGVTFFTGSALAFTVPLTTLLTSVAAISAGIGFAPDIPDIDVSSNLASNLSIQSSPNAVRGIPFGRIGIAGQILFREEIEGTGDNPDELLLILGLAGVPADALEKFWLNGVEVFDGDTTTGPGAITTGPFANELWLWFRTGHETSPAFPTIAGLSAAWANKARVLRGIPAIAIRLEVTERLKGRLEPLAQIRGMRLYDPRLDSTVPGGSGAHRFDDEATWEWSDNPKLCELMYFRGYDINGVNLFGMSEPADAIDIEHLASEANICDEQVPVVGGGTINRYTMNGMLFPEADHSQNLQLMLSASVGTIDASAGVLRTFAGAWRAPSGDPLTEADIDGAPNEIQLQPDPSTEVNIVQGVFADPNDGWEVKEYPSRVDQASIDAFGANAVTLDLPFTTDHRMAQRIAKLVMLRSNASRIMAARYWPKVLPLQPGDIVTQTYSRYTINAETFRVDVWGLEAVNDRKGQPTLRVPMRLVEEREEWFDWDEATEERQTQTVNSMPAIDNRPDLRTLDGQLVYEGPLPPANPKVGWLWLDTDVDIVYRWSGSGWEEFSRIGADGIDGSDAILLTISSTAQSFKYDSAGALIEPSAITFSAIRENSAATVNWQSQRWNGSAWVNTGTNRVSPATGLSTSLTEASFAAEAVNSLRIVATMTDGGTYTDAISVARLQDGATGATGSTGATGAPGADGDDGAPGADGDDAIVGLLTNENHSVQTANDGTGYGLGGAGGTFNVFDGTTDVTASAAFSVQGGATKNGLTISINAAGVYSLSGASWTSNEETFTLRAVYGGVTIDKVYTITKARQGADGGGVVVRQALMIPGNFTYSTTPAQMASSNSMVVGPNGEFSITINGYWEYTGGDPADGEVWVQWRPPGGTWTNLVELVLSIGGIGTRFIVSGTSAVTGMPGSAATREFRLMATADSGTKSITAHSSAEVFIEWEG